MSAFDEYRNAAEKVGRLAEQNSAMLDVLHDVSTFLEEQADAEYRPDSATPIPNAAMRLKAEVDDVIAKVGESLAPPVAWMRHVMWRPSSADGPAEWGYEFADGDAPPDSSEDWVPLYRRPSPTPSPTGA